MNQNMVVEFPHWRVKPAKYILHAAVIDMRGPANPMAEWFGLVSLMWLGMAAAWVRA